jgi:hypothetical protein
VLRTESAEMFFPKVQAPVNTAGLGTAQDAVCRTTAGFRICGYSSGFRLWFSLTRLAGEAFITYCLSCTAAHLCPPSFGPRRMDPASCSGSAGIRMGQASAAASATSWPPQHA